MSTLNATSVATVELSDLPDGLEELGSGGEGTVYRLGATSFSSRPCVFKKYKPQANVNEEHLEKLVKFITKLGEVGPERKDWLLEHCAWPTHLVRDNGKVVGIIMPLIPGRFFRTFGSGASTKKRAAELQFLLNDQTYMQSIGLTVTEQHRYEFLIDFANLLRVLHGAQVRVGDISVKNLLFCHDTPGSDVYLIDCDSMSIGLSEGPDVQTPNWDVPNGEKPQTVESDSYKFGLLVLRMLAADQGTRQVSDLPANTPPAIRQLTERALSASPTTRPTPKEWLGALAEGKQKASTILQTAPTLGELSGVSGSGVTPGEAGADKDGNSAVTKTVSRRKKNQAIPQAVSAKSTQPSGSNAANEADQTLATQENNAAEKDSLSYKFGTFYYAFYAILGFLGAIVGFAVGEPGTGLLGLLGGVVLTVLAINRSSKDDE